MVVLYYTSASFLDVILETIQSLKYQVELHVFIEISEQSKNRGTVVDVEDLQPMKQIEDPEKLLGTEKWNKLKDYFDGVTAVKFVVHKYKRSISFTSISTSLAVGRYIKKHKVNIVHFDTISTRAIGLVPYLKSRKVFITLHDPAPHSGEKDWRDNLPNRIFFPLAKGFFFYSGFATKQFIQNVPENKVPLYTLKLHPYTFISKLLSTPKPAQQSILFFGRLSYYKGIDLLLEAIPKVLAVFPDEQFIIAGIPVYGYEIDETLVEKYKKNITIITKYLVIEELIQYIERCKFVVCPYRDATQSGVLMTALAAQKMVVATNVGSFAEYIHDNENGLLTAPDAESIATKIIEALMNKKYLSIEEKLDPGHSKETNQLNGSTLMAAYNNVTPV